MKAADHYTVLFCEADTGIVLNADGSRRSAADPSQRGQFTFEKFADALAKKDELLAVVPNGEIVVTSAKGETATFRNDHLLDDFLRERAEVYRWLSSPPWIRWFKKRPECRFYQWDDENSSPRLRFGSK